MEIPWRKGINPLNNCVEASRYNNEINECNSIFCYSEVPLKSMLTCRKVDIVLQSDKKVHL